MFLILKANITDADFERITVHRGQLVTSYPSLARSLGISEKSVRVALEHLKETGEVAVKAYPKYSVITVVNYDKYQAVGQSKGQTNGSQTAVEGQTKGNNQRNKEIKNGKNKRNIDSNESIKDPFEVFAENDSLLLEALKNFEQMRKTIRKPLTDVAKNLLLKKLETFPHTQWVEILNQSTINSWQGIFPLKEEKSEAKKNNGFYTLSNGMETSNMFLAMLDKEENDESDGSEENLVYAEDSFPKRLQGNEQQRRRDDGQPVGADVRQ